MINKLSLRVLNPAELERGSLPAHVFDEQGGTIGQGADATWRLIDSSIDFGRIALEVLYYNQAFCFMDKTGYLKVNGMDTTTGVNRLVRFGHGDMLYLGKYQIQVSLQEQNFRLPDPLRMLNEHSLYEVVTDAAGNQSHIPFKPLEGEFRYEMTHQSKDPLSLLAGETSTQALDEFAYSKLAAEQKLKAQSEHIVPPDNLGMIPIEVVQSDLTTSVAASIIKRQPETPVIQDKDET